MIKKACIVCGKTFFSKSERRKCCSKECAMTFSSKRGTMQDEKIQLCCYCRYATGGCSWSDKFEPVRGWDAEPTIIKDSEIGDIPSYEIKHCPQFMWG